MINTIVVHSNIFNMSNISENEKDNYLNQLFIWSKFGLVENDVILFDSNNELEKEFYDYINDEENSDDVKIKMKAIYKLLSKRIIYAPTTQPHSPVQDECHVTLSILQKNSPDNIFLNTEGCTHRFCKSCIKNINCNIKLNYPNKISQWTKSSLNFSDIPEQYSFSDLVVFLRFNNLIKFCSEFCLYDKNLIPENSKDGITEEYLNNLELFLGLFKGKAIKPKIITYVTQNQKSTCIEKTRNAIKCLSKKINVDIDLKILKYRDINDKYAEQIHQRYIMTDIVSFSSDRGLNIIKNDSKKLNRSFDINVLPYGQIDIFRNYLDNLKTI